jgi:shikimate kinase
MNLILFGFKGCGKTTFGKLLADKMDRKFLDTDQIVMELYKQEHNRSLTAREIYQQLGEEGFRALEKRAVATLESVQNSIIAVGGGTVLLPENVERLQKLGQLVYLDAQPETLRKRIFLYDLPAFLTGEQELEEWIKQRKPIYEAIPAHRLTVDLLDDASAVAALRTMIILGETVTHP